MKILQEKFVNGCFVKLETDTFKKGKKTWQGFTVSINHGGGCSLIPCKSHDEASECYNSTDASSFKPMSAFDPFGGMQ